MNIRPHATTSARLAATAAVVAVSVAACTSSSNTTESPTSPEATTPGTAASPISVTLSPQPSGTVALNVDPQTQDVTAELHMIGFTPGSSHAMHIHQGSCAEQGSIIIPFPDVVADGAGAIDTTVTSAQPAANGLTDGTFLNIHLGSSDEMANPGSPAGTPISCSDITPPAPATLTMVPPPPADQRQGSASLTYDADNRTLTVETTVSGLDAGSSHAEHIHLGSCAAQGDVKYPLNDLVASPTGTADATTVIQDVDEAPPASGWYLNIHTGPSDQISRDGQPTLEFAPILCGDISA